jgi:uncharacterized protein YdhG (YjbR/CyaY superfamily)
MAGGSGTNDVDAYLAKVPEDQRAALEKIREIVRKVAPTATEGISYGFPTFKLEGRGLIWYAAWKKHCSIYPLTPGVSRAVGKELEPFDTEKGTIRFTPEKPLPASLIKKIAKARIAEEKDVLAKKR